MTKDLVPIEEISVTAEISEGGFKAGAKSRSLSALDRLLGSTIDLAGVPVEGLRDRMRARNEAREALIRLQSEQALKRLEVNDRTTEAVVESITADQARRSENLEAIAIEFMEELAEHEAEHEEPLDEDWMNVFASHAENASSERLRRLWARVLAGEVRKPGAFSLSTLRFVSELDGQIAALFQKYLTAVYMDQFLLKPKDLKGLMLIDLTFLEEVGLLSEVNGTLGFPLKPDDNGILYRRQGNLLLEMNMTGEARMNVIKLTRVGREISSILPAVSPERVLTEIFEHVQNSVESAKLSVITKELPNGNVEHIPIRVLKG